MPTRNQTRPTNVPLFAIGAVVLMVAFAVVLVIFARPGQNEVTLVIGLVGTTIPALIAAGFAEKTSRDVRNGVLQDKVRQGTHEALRESGVTEVAQNALQSNPASIAALARLVESLDRHDAREQRQEGTPG